MAIKYVHLDNGATLAILENTKYDAIHKIVKVLDSTKSLCFNPSKYLMQDVFKAASKPYGGDIYDKEYGEKEAKKKVMRKYYNQLDRKLDEFAEDLNAAMFEFCNRVNCTRKNRENA